jgi:hypothetical protein
MRSISSGVELSAYVLDLACQLLAQAFKQSRTFHA